MTQLIHPPEEPFLTLHGTCVDIKGRGVLIRGKPGMGKSSLALQLIDRGAMLVSDDQTILSLDSEKLVVGPPVSLRGMMEVRGIGLCSFPFKEKSYLKLCVEIDEEDVERLPDVLFVEYHKMKVPLLRLRKDDLLGTMKVELKLAHEDEYYV